MQRGSRIQLESHRTVRLVRRLIAVLALLLIALATAAPATAAKPCWRQVLDDWTDNTRLNGTYPISCYDTALKNLPEDIVSYTDAYDHIADARQDALQGDRVLSGSGSGGDDNDPDAGGGPLGDMLSAGTDSADSIPLPLLILGGLATLLMAAGGAGLLSRKLQARRAGGPGAPPDDLAS
jgi:hypothetical protein